MRRYLSLKFILNGFCISSLILIYSKAHSKSIFLNGTDISSVRNHHLKKVDLFIDPKGNIIIQAPHYQVHLIDQYTPLQHPLVVPSATPTHQPPQLLTRKGMAPPLAGDGGSGNFSHTPTPGDQQNATDPRQEAPDTLGPSPSAKVAPIDSGSAADQEIPLEKFDNNLEDERLTPKIGSKTIAE